MYVGNLKPAISVDEVCQYLNNYGVEPVACQEIVRKVENEYTKSVAMHVKLNLKIQKKYRVHYFGTKKFAFDHKYSKENNKSDTILRYGNFCS